MTAMFILGVIICMLVVGTIVQMASCDETDKMAVLSLLLHMLGLVFGLGWAVVNANELYWK